ncbi:MAG: patatin-like phospholipase family protein [Gemmatimonadaceae bacterium]|jgi:hypothetical protein|nr:patatin-like phospholipase family protein [Gemmatimonadaceae bacterium]
MRLLPLALILLSSACAAINRPPASVASLTAESTTLAERDRTLRDSVIARLVRRAERRGDRHLDVLLLSGGGQNGAYGAGFLRGWQRRSDASMPRFDLVSGISTGALQAPYALLGTREALDTISALYARAATSIAPTFDWWFWIRRTGGIVNTERFDRTLAQAIDGDFRTELREAFADDRQIVFGTTDFDLGIGQLWSLGDELDSSEAGLGRARMLLKAATAIPAIFPPVMVDGHVHADGGVVENVLPVLGLADYRRLGEALNARGLRDVTVRLWVVLNVWSHADPRAIAPSKRGQMDARSTTLLFYLHQPSTLEKLDYLARAVSAEVPGLRLEMRVTAIPSEQSVAPGADKLFNRSFMQRLDSLGFARAQSGNPWDVVPSAFVRPEAGRR